MANVLLLDANEVAGRAMQGIVARGHHRCIAVPTIAEAWKALHDMVNIDLIFLELELHGEKGIGFLQRLRADCFLKQIPVIIYTTVSDHAIVRTVLLLKVQNYLIKPYNDEYIFREITKASASAWRALQFEEEKSFCVQMSYKPELLRSMRQELSESLDKSIPFFTACVISRNPPQVNARIDALSEKAEACGVWGVVDCMAELREKAAQEEWGHFKQCEEDLTFARELILLHLDPKRVVNANLSDEEKEAQRESEVRAIWMQTDVDKSGPMIGAEDVLLQAEALPACPTIDSVAAAFLMTADKTAANLNQINDLVAKDPSLLAQVLIAANHLDHDEMTVIDDPRTAVGLLGNLKLTAMAKTLPVIPERHLHMPPITWVHFWMFQMGVARLAQFCAQSMELELLVSRAHTAGLLNDIGKLVLLKLFPFALPAMVNYSHEHKVPLHAAERKFIGCTTREIGERFARKLGLPPAYCNVIRWTEEPAKSGEDVELVGIVSLARDLCLHNHVGFCGDTPKDTAPPIEDTAAWQVLRPRIFPSFNLKKFESDAHALCLELKQNLAGKRSS